MRRGLIVTRALLQATYPGCDVDGFTPTHWVRLFVGSSKTPIREDYVRLENPDARGIRFGFVPHLDEAAYAVIPSGKWQCLEQHGNVKAKVVRYLPEYVPPSECDGFVYFVQSGELGAIKIGWSQDVNRRIDELQVANAKKLFLLGAVPGRMEDEAALHEQFAHLRMNGEWFQDHPEIREYVYRATVNPLSSAP